MAVSSFPFQVAQITFTAFTLENAASTGCVWDWVKVIDGATVVQKCGTDSPGTVTTSGNTARVEFHSDYSVTRTGFSATITFVDAGCPTGPGPCPGGPVEMVIARKTLKHTQKQQPNTKSMFKERKTQSVT